MEKKRIKTASYYTIDRLNASVLFIPEKSAVNTVKHARKKWYNRKTPRGAKVVKTMINYLHETKTDKESLFFVTITTQQHKNGLTDMELWHRVGRWLKGRELPYVCTVERQTHGFNGSTPTEDLHFHICVRASSKFDIPHELGRLAKYFQVEKHPALLDIKRVQSVGGLVGYITKYVTKQPTGKKFGDCSSLFSCRTFSVSNTLRRSYKRTAWDYVRRVQGSTNCIGFLNECGGLTPSTDLNGNVIKNKFFGSFKYSPEIWQVAKKYSTAENIQFNATGVPLYLLINERK